MLLGFSCSQSCPMAREVLAQGICLWFDVEIPFMALHHQLVPLRRPNITTSPQEGPEFFRTEKGNGLCFPSHVPFQVFLWPIGNHLGRAGKDLAASTTRIQGSLEPLVPSLPFPDVPPGATAWLSRKSSSSISSLTFATSTSPSGEAPASFIKNKKPSWRG